MIRSSSGKSLLLAPTRPNAGIEAAYRKKLDALIEDMHASLLWWIGAAYKRSEPEPSALSRLAADGELSRITFDPLAADESPANVLRGVLRRLSARWTRRFTKVAPELAAWFAGSSQRHADSAARATLKRNGFSVKFRMTRAAKDAVQATIGENVSLIKSIPSQHLTQVEGIVMRSIQAGRDLGPLAADLERQFGVTRRRAALLARDQNNKATAIIARVRQQELGIKEAKWLHSAGGKHPRPSHVKASGDTYEIAKGMLIDGEFIWPGHLINCRCVSRPIVKGFS